MGSRGFSEAMKAINEKNKDLAKKFESIEETFYSLLKMKDEENMLLHIQFNELIAKNEELKNKLISMKSKFEEEQAKKDNEIQMLQQAVQDKEEEIEKALEKLNKMTTTITMKGLQLNLGHCG